MVLLKKREAGSDSFGNVWVSERSVVDVPDEQAVVLLGIADAGFSVVDQLDEDEGGGEDEGGEGAGDGDASDGGAPGPDASPGPDGGDQVFGTGTGDPAAVVVEPGPDVPGGPPVTEPASKPRKATRPRAGEG